MTDSAFQKKSTVFWGACAAVAVVTTDLVMKTSRVSSWAGSTSVYRAASTTRTVGMATSVILERKAGVYAGSRVRLLAVKTVISVTSMVSVVRLCPHSPVIARQKSPSPSPVMALANVILLLARPNPRVAVMELR